MAAWRERLHPVLEEGYILGGEVVPGWEGRLHLACGGCPCVGGRLRLG